RVAQADLADVSATRRRAVAYRGLGCSFIHDGGRAPGAAPCPACRFHASAAPGRSTPWPCPPVDSTAERVLAARPDRRGRRRGGRSWPAGGGTVTDGEATVLIATR